MNEEAIRDRARRAGIAIDWIDADDQPRRVSANSLKRILDALGYDGKPCHQPLITTTQGKPAALPDLQVRRVAELALEDGTRQTIVLEPSQGVPPVATPGYHRLRYADREVTHRRDQHSQHRDGRFHRPFVRDRFRIGVGFVGGYPYYPYDYGYGYPYGYSYNAYCDPNSVYYDPDDCGY